MKRRAALVAVLLVVVAGCVPGAREAAPFEGRWVSEGFGMFMLIDGGTVEIYEHTPVSCVRVHDGAARGISDVLSLEGDRLVLDDDGRVIRFDRIDFLPQRCAADFFDEDADATLDVVDATFRRHYLPGVDDGWGDRVDMARTASTLEDLHTALLELLGPLGDPEVRIAAEGVTELSWVSSDPAAAVRVTLPGSVRDVGSGLLSTNLGDVSYLAITSLEAIGSRQEAALAVALDRELAGAGDVLILDLRMASGGLDRVARLIASRFVPTMRSIGVRLVAVAGGMVPAGEVSVSPLPTGTYRGRLVVLTGPGTSGAGEILAAALLTIPGTIVAGEPTAGRPGQPLVRMLPTGWSVGVPHLSFRTAAGDLIGPHGIVPHVPLESGPTQLDQAVNLASG